MTRKQKAAIIVRLILNEKAEVPLDGLPDEMQIALTRQMGAMRHVDRTTLANVIGEFAEELDAMGLIFPEGIAGALNDLDGKISPHTAARLRKEAGVKHSGDPWERIKGLSVDLLLPVLETESTEVAAVMLAKLNVATAAELLGKLPGAKARRITYAISLTGSVTPDAVDRIGLSLASQLDAQPELAFEEGPVERVGAILNFSPAVTRDDVLDGLDETDKMFADQVRKAIFTFANIPARIAPRDIPKVIREVDQALLVTALAAASEGDLAASADFILENMSGRMADSLREEMGEAGKIKAKDGEEAMTAVINAIREMEARGELLLVAEDDEEEE
ncbi:MAG: FliG C-terminal domain-containing protein [Rhodobacterales bacterium]|nr:FliG C-terminal domain-containing protein [Rhodobacterales bacterium]